MESIKDQHNRHRQLVKLINEKMNKRLIGKLDLLNETGKYSHLLNEISNYFHE